MQTKELIQILESWAPSSYQESYDNSGLLLGEYSKEITKALISLDCTEEVIQEAIDNQCQIVIAHHPILFSGIKRLNGSNYVERAILKAIKHDVSIYAIHTNLDNVITGVNHMMAEKIGLKNCKILSPKRQLLKKLVVYIPKMNFEEVTTSIFKAGAGNIGNYSECGFSNEGTGTYKGNDLSNPAIGTKNKLERADEVRFETIFPSYLETRIIASLLKSHPYEEVAYDLMPLDNFHPNVGSGLIGELENETDLNQLLSILKNEFKIPSIKHTQSKERIKKVALCGGSGSFLRFDAIKKEADAFISSDFKYHEWFDHENKIEFIDIGHYESEQYTPELISRYLQKNAVYLQSQISRVNTNPVKYYI